MVGKYEYFVGTARPVSSDVSGQQMTDSIPSQCKHYRRIMLFAGLPAVLLLWYVYPDCNVYIQRALIDRLLDRTWDDIGKHRVRTGEWPRNLTQVYGPSLPTYYGLPIQYDPDKQELSIQCNIDNSSLLHRISFGKIGYSSTFAGCTRHCMNQMNDIDTQYPRKAPIPK